MTPFSAVQRVNIERSFRTKSCEAVNRHFGYILLMLLYQISEPFLDLLIVLAKLGPLIINDAKFLRIRWVELCLQQGTGNM